MLIEASPRLDISFGRYIVASLLYNTMLYDSRKVRATVENTAMY